MENWLNTTDPDVVASLDFICTHDDEIVDGLLLAQRMLGARHGIVGVEDNMPGAPEALRAALARRGSDARVEVLPERYAQGAEKQMVYALTGRTVLLGSLPADVGVATFNVATAAAISRAIRQGKPLIDRVITLAGRIAQPCNLRARIGTAVGDLVDECGGLTEGVEKVVLGGPMMGAALPRLDMPITKGACGILAFGREGIGPRVLACIRCGRCHQGCPMKLLPNQIDLASQNKRWDLAEKYNAPACMECGICSYVCPSKRNVSQACATAKAAIRARPAKKKRLG